MPDADPRLDRGRWAAASLRPLPEAPPPSSSSSSASPAPRGHAPRGLWRRLAGCCGCCRRAGREDWDPQPGEVPGTRPPQRIRPGLLVPTGLVLGSAANRVAHHTAAFAGPLLVVRRGQPFELRLLLPRPFDPEGDALCVELLLGPTPQVAKGTHVLIPLGERSATGWMAEVAGEEAEPEGAGPGGHALILNLSAPPDAPIGRYRVSVKTRTGEGEFAAPFSPGNDVVLLFNPWCPEDAVFMEPTSDLDEFVLNESGTIFYGTEEQIAERAWNYGQVPKIPAFPPKIPTRRPRIHHVRPKNGGNRPKNGGNRPKNGRVGPKKGQVGVGVGD
ncbi:protein-glutamine gamma-glutamyltransferase K-like [Columba livia]|uniref:protein-glutamine gamma-glutamyltransferase K-like n=1 Tax=Columba livia TaxID=8932 RepID=UPI0031BB6267